MNIENCGFSAEFEFLVAVFLMERKLTDNSSLWNTYLDVTVTSTTDMLTFQRVGEGSIQSLKIYGEHVQRETFLFVLDQDNYHI